MEEELPHSWKLCKVRDLGQVVAGGTPSTKTAEYWGNQISWITPADLTGYRNKFIGSGAKSISQKGLEKSSAKLMPSGSVHFSSRAPIGYTVISSQSLCTNQGFKSLVPANGVFNEYIYYYFKSIKSYAESVATGTTFKELSGRAFSALPVPLPPLPEQKRIVTKIEELFSELDAGEASFKQARKQLGIYRQSLLKQAFEGKLTERWRAENPDQLEDPETLLARIQQEREARHQQQLTDWEQAVEQWEQNGKEGKKPAKPRKQSRVSTLSRKAHNELPSLPESWRWCLLEEICEFANGDRGKNYPNRSEYVSKGIPWINTGHIEPDGSLSPKRMNFITREKFESLNGGQIREGDLVYCLRGATFGKTAFVRPYHEGAIASSLMIVRPTFSDSSELIYRYLLSPLGKSQLKRFDNGSAQPNLSASNVGLYEFPLCSLPEQQEIVRLLESQFAVIEQNEREIDAALKRSEALRQSILKRAFSGQLVPQDPNDEPASELLARIETEREATAAAAKPKKKTAKEKSAKKKSASTDQTLLDL